MASSVSSQAYSTQGPLRRSRPRSTSSSSQPSSNGSVEQKKKKKDTRVLGFLTLKEPSATALEDYAAQQKKLAAQRGRTSMAVGVPGVSSQKLPDHVPRVNSKWDGLPQATSRQSVRHSAAGPLARLSVVTSADRPKSEYFSVSSQHDQRLSRYAASSASSSTSSSTSLSDSIDSSSRSSTRQVESPGTSPEPDHFRSKLSTSGRLTTKKVASAPAIAPNSRIARSKTSEVAPWEQFQPPSHSSSTQSLARTASCDQSTAKKFARIKISGRK